MCAAGSGRLANTRIHWDPTLACNNYYPSFDMSKSQYPTCQYHQHPFEIVYQWRTLWLVSVYWSSQCNYDHWPLHWWERTRRVQGHVSLQLHCPTQLWQWNRCPAVQHRRSVQECLSWSHESRSVNDGFGIQAALTRNLSLAYWESTGSCVSSGFKLWIVALDGTTTDEAVPCCSWIAAAQVDCSSCKASFAECPLSLLKHSWRRPGKQRRKGGWLGWDGVVGWGGFGWLVPMIHKDIRI